MDGVECTLEYQEPAESNRRTEHSIWNYLLTHSDAGTVNRLRSDPAFQVDPRLMTVQLKEEGTRGFSVSVEQLRQAVERGFDQAAMRAPLVP